MTRIVADLPDYVQFKRTVNAIQLNAGYDTASPEKITFMCSSSVPYKGNKLGGQNLWLNSSLFVNLEKDQKCFQGLWGVLKEEMEVGVASKLDEKDRFFIKGHAVSDEKWDPGKAPSQKDLYPTNGRLNRIYTCQVGGKGPMVAQKGGGLHAIEMAASIPDEDCSLKELLFVGGGKAWGITRNPQEVYEFLRTRLKRGSAVSQAPSATPSKVIVDEIEW